METKMVNLKLIVAVCDGLGIGSKGTLPWPRLSNEMKYFRRMTTTCKDATKKNAVVMGRRTWESIPEQHRPLNNRLNIVLTRNKEYAINSEGVLVMPSLKDALAELEKRADEIESCWIIGGSSVYAEGLTEPSFRLYVTHIRKHFDCDTFIKLDMDELQEVADSEVDATPQLEKEIKYEFKVYERK